MEEILLGVRDMRYQDDFRYCPGHLNDSSELWLCRIERPGGDRVVERAQEMREWNLRNLADKLASQRGQ